ncbi:MAG: hypothetical protein M1828_002596 [Chrysothrix sp. TS-e1954]|nr:MAG: hypothetical protein M1828_002596 [Chrysothrix sp. TS-e1954]
MAPLTSFVSTPPIHLLENLHLHQRRTPLAIGKPTLPAPLTLEAWAQGFMVGSLIIMAFITISNMRRGVLLHKLILIELLLGMFHGTFIFTSAPVYGWYLGATATLLNISWSLHNVIAWMKSKPFLSHRWSIVYIATVAIAQPYWVIEIYANFAYFNGINDWFKTTRPWEALFRDPWWLLTTILLYHRIITHYRIPLLTVITISPRFGVLLLSMLLSLSFILLDILSVTHVINDEALPDGLNPFWKLAFVFKCLCDSIVLDDFKTALERLLRYRLRLEGCGDTYDVDASSSGAGGGMAGAGPISHLHVRDQQGSKRQERTVVKDKEDEESLTYDESSSGESDHFHQLRSQQVNRGGGASAARRQRFDKYKSDIAWIEKELAMHSSSGSSPVDDYNHTGDHGSLGRNGPGGEGREGEGGRGGGGTGFIERLRSKQARAITSPVEHYDEMPNLSVLRSLSYVGSHHSHNNHSGLSQLPSHTSPALNPTHSHQLTLALNPTTPNPTSPTNPTSPRSRNPKEPGEDEEDEQDTTSGLREHEYDKGDETHGTRHGSEPCVPTVFSNDGGLEGGRSWVPPDVVVVVEPG